MIDPGSGAMLLPRERFALDQLIDGSTLLRATGEATSCAVRLEFLPGQESAPLGRLVAPDFKPFVIGDGVVGIPRALLAGVADLLTMRSDGAAALRDRHGRPTSENNALVIAGASRIPVVSRLSMTLRNAVREAARDRHVWCVAPWPGSAQWAAALSHDLDVASLWPAFTLLRVAELARKGEFARASRVLAAAAGQIAGDPVRGGVEAVLAAEAMVGARSSWFIICATPTFASIRAADVTYLPESPRVRRLVQAIQTAGHEIGLHGSMETVLDGARFAAQRSRLEAIAGRSVSGVRQHFLRRVVGETERQMERAGFAYDSTGGFPDRNGFRTGTADVQPLWDDLSGAPLGLEEVPFCWMDRAQSKYQGVEEPWRWVEDAIELADACAAVQGVWCGIWHPNLTSALGFPDATQAYLALVRALSLRGAWLAPLDEIVRWRVARRSLHIIAAPEATAPVVRANPSALRAAGHPLVIVDATGREALRVAVQ